MQRRKNNLHNFTQTRAFCMLAAVGIGFFVIMGCLFLFSLLISKIDMPEGAVSVMSTVALCVGAFSGGFSCAKKRRKNGLVMGIATGGIMFFIVLLLSLIFAKTAITFTAASKLFWTVVFSAIGGIIGVNSKKQKY